MEIISFVIILVFILSIQKYIFLKFSLQDLEYSCRFSVTEANEGDEILLIETLSNNKLLPLPWLKVEIFTSKWLSFAETNSVVAQDTRFVTSGFFLWGFQKTTRSWKVKCLKRGHYIIDSVSFVSGDIFGASTSVSIKINESLSVYPRTLDLQNIFTSRHHLTGDNLVRKWIIDDPFLISGIREYCPGDSINRIHWKVSSKLGSIYVKKNEYTSKQDVIIILNIQSTDFDYNEVLYKERVEHGISLAATFLWNSYGSGLAVRFITNGMVKGIKDRYIITDSDSKKEHFIKIYDLLSRLELEASVYFEELLKEITHIADNSDVLIITSYLSEDIIKIVKYLCFNDNSVKILATSEKMGCFRIPEDMQLYFYLGDEKINE